MNPTTTDIFQKSSLLFLLKIRHSFYGLIEFIHNVLFYYPKNLKFMKVDLFLRLRYLFDSPYSISKRFLANKSTKLFTYGETPLPTLDMIAKICKIKAQDHVFELGCGIGNTCFWLHSFIGCKVTGIDNIEQFITRANKAKKNFNFECINFIHEDFFATDLSNATVIYLYGTTLEESEIEKLIQKFKTLKSGTKIITVSYPLNDYCENNIFELMKCFTVKFPWGSAEVYMQIKK